MLSPDQLPDVHGHIAELVAEKTAQTHEGGGVPHDLLRIRDNFTPARRSSAGEQTERPLSPDGESEPAEKLRASGREHSLLCLCPAASCYQTSRFTEDATAET